MAKAKINAELDKELEITMQDASDGCAIFMEIGLNKARELAKQCGEDISEICNKITHDGYTAAVAVELERANTLALKGSLPNGLCHQYSIQLALRFARNYAAKCGMDISKEVEEIVGVVRKYKPDFDTQYI